MKRSLHATKNAVLYRLVVSARDCICRTTYMVNLLLVGLLMGSLLLSSLPQIMRWSLRNALTSVLIAILLFASFGSALEILVCRKAH